MKQARTERIISHRATICSDDDALKQSIQARLTQRGDLPSSTVEQQIHLLDELFACKLGRFLLHNRGLNAYWTHRLVTHGRADSTSWQPVSELERQLFETLPTVLATRERFQIFQAQLQARLKPYHVLASVPCGLMGELLLLDCSSQPDVRFIGVDLDQHALDAAFALAQERGLADRVSLRCEDAWASSLCEEVDMLTSNGLNIYEQDDSRVTGLYRAFLRALKPGGTLITSFLTPPPSLSPKSPWDLAAIDPAAAALQQTLFMHILEVQWSAFRTHAQTLAQLTDAGFVDVTFIDDRARLFPTVIAHKPS